MDGNESKNLWDQLSNFFKNYFERFTNWSAKHGIKISKDTTKKVAQKGKDFVNKNKTEYALNCVKEAGATKELRSSGVYDGKEMREIAQLAKDRNIPILIRKEDAGYGRREMSHAQVQKITKHQKELSKLKEKQSKFAGDKTKVKKLRKIMSEIDNLENQIKVDSKMKTENYSFIVNASSNAFAKEIEEQYGKTEVAKAQSEIDERTGFDTNEKTFISLNKSNSEITVADLKSAGNYGNLPVESFENKKHINHVISVQSYVNLIRDPNFAESFDHSASKKENSNQITVLVSSENEEQWLAFYDNDKVNGENSKVLVANDKSQNFNGTINRYEFKYDGESFSKLKDIHKDNEIAYNYTIEFREDESTPYVVLKSNLDKEKMKELIPLQKKTNEQNLNKQRDQENTHLKNVQKGLSKESQEKEFGVPKANKKKSSKSKER